MHRNAKLHTMPAGYNTVLRFLINNKGFTLLNVAGLALALTAFLLINLFITDELRFDRFNENADRIYRVNTDLKFGEAASSQAIAAPVVASALLKSFPEIENTARLLRAEQRLQNGEHVINEKNVAYADPSLFDVFSFPSLHGDAKSALSDPTSIVITESTAKKYFGKTAVVGEKMVFAGDKNNAVTVRSVIRDIPKQSHFRFDMFLPMSKLDVSRNTNFAALYPFQTYLLLKKGASARRLEVKFKDFVQKNLGFTDELEKSGDYYRLNLTPLTDIHLHSNRLHELGINGDVQYVGIFSASAIFILLIACFNFINFSTARSASRLRDAGIRKILGASRRSLIIRFIVESMMVTATATILALIAAAILLPFFNELSGKHLAFNGEMLLWSACAAIILSIVVGLLCGAYPAIMLSSFHPASAVKTTFITSAKGKKFRATLVVTQFVLSVCLIVTTLTINRQMEFIRSKDIGFNRNQVLVIKHINALGDGQSAILKDEVKRMSGVLNASLSSFLPTGERRWQNYISSSGTNLQTQFWPVDENYVDVMEMQVVKGRNFSRTFPTDSLAMIINETAARMLGYSNDAVGKNIYYGESEKEFHIIGVVKDFNFRSFKENISPVVLLLTTPWSLGHEGDGADNLCIRLNGKDASFIIANLKRRWHQLSHGEDFDYTFMDEDFNAFYQGEQRMASMFLVFAVMAIAIACLGLFGLTAYTVERRTKEIAIRKILGANSFNILSLLTADFTKLVMIAICVALPLSSWLMQRWLNNYVYRTQLPVWLFIVAGATALLIAFITVCVQSFKASVANPAKDLRSE
jgi:putative ABC transport system permease protein